MMDPDLYDASERSYHTVGVPLQFFCGTFQGRRGAAFTQRSQGLSLMQSAFQSRSGAFVGKRTETRPYLQRV